jgi:hypothetical protein
MFVQIGWNGSVAEGTMDATGNGTETELDQVLRAPGAPDMRIRHLSTTTKTEHITRSFDWVDGAWQDRRTYVWKRVKKPTE